MTPHEKKADDILRDFDIDTGFSNDRISQEERTNMLMTPLRCWRNRTDCEPLHSIEAMPDGMTPEEYESPEFTPKSFVCCGINHSGSREIAQDCYRLCFKNETGDEMTDNDLQDLTHVAAVITQALAITATRMVNGGTVPVPAMQGDEVAHEQPLTGAEPDAEWHAPEPRKQSDLLPVGR